MNALPDPSPTLLALQGVLAGRYALERELGRGGMGIVFLARDLALDRPVAIKLLPAALAAVPAHRERFLREARTAAGLSHPHIVPIHAVEDHTDYPLFVMAYVEGETLSQRIERQGPLLPEEAARILQEVAWALAYAHQRGIIHRDVKPDNILLERGSGRALVTDFGIAVRTGNADSTERADEADTHPGVIGTIRYMSPEQISGGRVDGRSDLFSLGATAHRALTGRPPFEGAASALTSLALRAPIPPVASLRPELPPRLAAIVDRCLALDPAQRFPDGESLAEALGAARERRIAVPVPVERFVDLYKTLATEIAGGTAILAVLAAELLIVQTGAAAGLWIQAAILTVILVWSFFGLVGLGGLRFIQVVRVARRLLEQGYGIADVRTALDRPGPVVPGAPANPVKRVAGIVGGLSAAALWAVIFRWQMGFTLGPLVDGFLMAVLTIAPVVAVRGVLARLLRPGKRGWWSRFWWKTLEWKVFRLAGRRGQARALPGSEPTEAALGAGILEQFERLPSELRRRFEEVPEVVERLAAQAARLRSGTNPEAAERLASTFAALEHLRLDLLRLSAGAASGAELTGDLDAARQIAERIEALLAAREELG